MNQDTQDTDGALLIVEMVDRALFRAEQRIEAGYAVAEKQRITESTRAASQSPASGGSDRMIAVDKSTYRYLTATGSVNGERLAWFQITLRAEDSETGEAEIVDLSNGREFRVVEYPEHFHLYPIVGMRHEERLEYVQAFENRKTTQITMKLDNQEELNL